jgi:hypothetical protein
MMILMIIVVVVVMTVITTTIVLELLVINVHKLVIIKQLNYLVDVTVSLNTAVSVVIVEAFAFLNNLAISILQQLHHMRQHRNNLINATFQYLQQQLQPLDQIRSTKRSLSKLNAVVI